MHGNGSGPGLCESGVLERPRYFPRQLLTPAEMTLEQSYFRDRMRRHNRLLHGWGVVCGGRVCLVANADGGGPEPWTVRVQPGYMLGPQGDDIVIDRERELDLRTSGMTGVTGEPSQAADPWCVEVPVRRDQGPLYVAVKYREVMTRPVRVQPAGCGCDDSQCEYSRLCDGYEIGVLTACPSSHAGPPAFADLATGAGPLCPPCPPDPWVVLAKVEVGADGEIESIDNCDCRRQVLGLAEFWWRCADGRIEFDQVTVAGTPAPGEEITVDVTGSGFLPGATATLGAGVSVQKVDVVSENSLKIEATIAEQAAPGPRTLTVSNPACTVGVRTDAITITAGRRAAESALRPEAAPERPPRTRGGQRKRGGGKRS
jgi:hypothetical protein